MDNQSLVTLTADITAAFVSNNRVATSGISELISSVHSALNGLKGLAVEEAPVRLEPVVPVRTSVKPDYIVCLEDGKKLKMLKRHLMTHYQMTPAQYREKWSLKADYPMVAPNYAETRKALALKSGLGRKTASPPVEAPPAAKPKRKAAKPATAQASTTEAPPAAAKPKRKTLKPALANSPPPSTGSSTPKRGRRKAPAEL